MSTINQPANRYRILACILGLAGAAFCQDLPLSKQRIVTEGGKTYLLNSRLKSILVGDFFYNFNHQTNNSPQNLINTLRVLAGTEGWTVDVTRDGNEVTAAKLKGYQIFFANYISAWASGTGFPQANRTAVQDFVETQGGGLFLMHASGDSRVGGKWPWYYETAHPVEYTGESLRISLSAPVFIPQAAKTHPIMEGVNFDGKDTVIFPQGEWDSFNKLITEVHPEASLLLNMDGTRCTKAGMGTNCGSTFNYSVPGGYPISWTFPDKQGTIGYFMEAHDLVTMNAMTKPVWDKFFKQFMYYIAGYDTVTTVSLSPEASGSLPVLDASGITFHASDHAGVFIHKAGRHIVSLYDIAGRGIREIRGSRSPIDYDLSAELKGSRSGIYVLRVAMGGTVRSKRYFVR